MLKSLRYTQCSTLSFSLSLTTNRSVKYGCRITFKRVKAYTWHEKSVKMPRDYTSNVIMMNLSDTTTFLCENVFLFLLCVALLHSGERVKYSYLQIAMAPLCRLLTHQQYIGQKKTVNVDLKKETHLNDLKRNQ